MSFFKSMITFFSGKNRFALNNDVGRRERYICHANGYDEDECREIRVRIREGIPC
jgi:hypothetical protein